MAGEAVAGGSPPASGPKVSVVVIAYNQSAYIDQALGSIIDQKCAFPVEIVVSDDGSTDGTREKIAAWARGHPDLVRPLYQPRNLGAVANLDAALRECRGELVACLEGDDYWTDPKKLQLQVDCLEADPEVVACFHPMEARDGKSGDLLYVYPNPAGRRAFRSVSDVLRHHVIPANARMWRRHALPFLDPRLFRVGMGDWAMDVALVLQGSIAYVDRVMGVYRIHGGGIWSSGSDLARRRMIRDCSRFFYRTLPPDFRPDAYAILINAEVEYMRALGQKSTLARLLAVPEYIYWVAKMPIRDAAQYVGLLFRL